MPNIIGANPYPSSVDNNRAMTVLIGDVPEGTTLVMSARLEDPDLGNKVVETVSAVIAVVGKAAVQPGPIEPGVDPILYPELAQAAWQLYNGGKLMDADGGGKLLFDKFGGLILNAAECVKAQQQAAALGVGDPVAQFVIDAFASSLDPKVIGGKSE